MMKKKIYVTSRFKGDDNRDDIENLCLAVRNAGYLDFSFTRDIENYEKKFSDPIELWRVAKDEIKKCDVLLIDVTDHPTGGRVIEAGIAYGMQIPVITICKKGVQFKDLYNGISQALIEYESMEDITYMLQAMKP